MKVSRYVFTTTKVSDKKCISNISRYKSEYIYTMIYTIVYMLVLLLLSCCCFLCKRDPSSVGLTEVSYCSLFKVL